MRSIIALAFPAQKPTGHESDRPQKPLGPRASVCAKPKTAIQSVPLADAERLLSRRSRRVDRNDVQGYPFARPRDEIVRAASFRDPDAGPGESGEQVGEAEHHQQEQQERRQLGNDQGCRQRSVEAAFKHEFGHKDVLRKVVGMRHEKC